MEFIRNNMSGAPQQVDPQQVAEQAKVAQQQEAAEVSGTNVVPQPVQAPAPEVAEAPTYTSEEDFIASSYDSNDASSSGIDLIQPREVPEEAEAATESAEPEEIDELLADNEIDETDDAELTDQQINFKKLRKTVREIKTEKTQIQQELEQTKAQLQKYESGEANPEVFEQLNSRVAQLESYEKIVNLKSSKEYIDKYSKPITELNSKLKEIAADYEIPEDIMKQALHHNKDADLNRFLSNHFDPVGATEVKGIVSQLKQLNEEAVNAEKEPSLALARLQEQHAETVKAQEAQRKERIHSNSKQSWAKAYQTIKEQGVAEELIFKEDDPEHNDKFVKPLMQSAANSYKEFVHLLDELGVKDLPEKLATALAKSVLLAHASAVSIDSRNAALAELAELRQNTQRTRSFMRPGVGGNVANSSPASSRGNHQTPSPAQAGLDLINQVRGK